MKRNCRKFNIKNALSFDGPFFATIPAGVYE
jgi:hypothetical protein